MKSYLVKSQLSTATMLELAPYLSGSPIQFDLPFFLTIGLVVADEPPILDEGMQYLTKFSRMSIHRSPFTGNSCLFMEMVPSDIVRDRVNELQALTDAQHPTYPVFMEMSHQVHEIPRHRRAWINSLSESMLRSEFIFKFDGEFLEEVTVDPNWATTWPTM